MILITVLIACMVVLCILMIAMQVKTLKLQRGSARVSQATNSLVDLRYQLQQVEINRLEGRISSDEAEKESRLIMHKAEKITSKLGGDLKELGLAALRASETEKTK